MADYEIVISEVHIGGHKVVGVFHGDSYEAVSWLREQIKWLRRVPYEVPRFEGEEPLEGVGMTVKDETGFDYSDIPDYPEDYYDEDDLWANLYERDDRGDVYELVGSLRDDNS